VVEDEEAIRRGIADALRFAGYTVAEAGDGPGGLDRALAPGCDMVLLDLMLPGMSGFDVLEELRRSRPRLPVIILTARGAEEDRVRGLRDGADDYVVKPFSARELLARIEAVLRRSAERPHPLGTLPFPGGCVDFEKAEIRLGGGTAKPLTPREGDLLSYLAANRERAVSRLEILERVWGIDARGLDTRAVDMLVARLRSKLGDAGPDVVVTVRSKGYRLGDST
jgi:DNA-binding response OmpR family regulator